MLLSAQHDYILRIPPPPPVLSESELWKQFWGRGFQFAWNRLSERKSYSSGRVYTEKKGFRRGNLFTII
jgi:hypothetical protein